MPTKTEKPQHSPGSDHYITAEELEEGRSIICKSCERKWIAARVPGEKMTGQWVSQGPRDHYLVGVRTLCGRGVAE